MVSYYTAKDLWMQEQNLLTELVSCVCTCTYAEMDYCVVLPKAVTECITAETNA